MFTGIITDIGTITEFSDEGNVWRLEIESNYNHKQVDIGASISNNGACLTVIEKGSAAKGKSYFVFELSPETIEKTIFKFAGVGEEINLERAMKIGDELGGHMVTGHVDSVIAVAKVLKNENNWIVEFNADKEQAKYIATKGSACINGVSLTVNSVSGNNFSVNIIPHTLENTNLKNLKEGSKVNLEIDLIARYIERINSFNN